MSSRRNFMRSDLATRDVCSRDPHRPPEKLEKPETKPRLCLAPSRVLSQGQTLYADTHSIATEDLRVKRKILANQALGVVVTGFGENLGQHAVRKPGVVQKSPHRFLQAARNLRRKKGTRSCHRRSVRGCRPAASRLEERRDYRPQRSLSGVDHCIPTARPAHQSWRATPPVAQSQGTGSPVR